MGVAIRAEHLSKEYRLGIINHGMLYKDMQTWLARRMGREDPHAKIGAEHFDDTADRFWALKDLDFSIEQGDRVGLVGRNGAGKSTLLKILSRITAPTEGTIKIKGRVASLLEVGTGFHPELTGRDNVYLNGAILGMKRREVAKKFDEIVAFSEIEKFIDTPVKRYSSGMYVRLAFAVAAHLDSEILLADEVLAVGDAAFQKKCLGKMEAVSTNEGRTVIFVSHNMGAVSSLCNNAILLNSGRLKLYDRMDRVAAAYLSDGSAEEAHFPGELLETVSIHQVGSTLEVLARYGEDSRVDVPYLSLVVFDASDTPLFTVNTRNYDVRRLTDSNGRRAIKIVIDSPTLMNGQYSATVNFGNSGYDLIRKEKCLSFRVVDMAQSINGVAVSRYGSVYPSCEYYVS